MTLLYRRRLGLGKRHAEPCGSDPAGFHFAADTPSGINAYASPRLPCVRSCRLPQKTSEAAMAKYMLVSFETCPWVQRSAIVLREKNTEFELRHIKADNRPDWFLAISPHKKVPVLSIDDKVSLFESNAIKEYLDETIAPRLHPEDPIERAINRAWTDYVPTFASIVTATAYADTEADYNKRGAE